MTREPPITIHVPLRADAERLRAFLAARGCAVTLTTEGAADAPENTMSDEKTKTPDTTPAPDTAPNYWRADVSAAGDAMSTLEELEKRTAERSPNCVYKFGTSRLAPEKGAAK